MKRIAETAAAALLAVAPAWGAEIVEQDIAYEPEEIVVHAGEPLVLVNHDPFDHATELRDEEGHVLAKPVHEKPGARRALPRLAPGRYTIRCVLHDGMEAAIVVKP